MVLLFSGTVFGKGGPGFWVEQVPWHTQARVPDAGGRLGELMDALLPGRRVDQAAAGDAGRAAQVQGAARDPDLGSRDGPAAGRVGRERPRAGPGGRRRRALRGLPALPVPGVGGEEPRALAVGRARAAVVRVGRDRRVRVGPRRVPPRTPRAHDPARQAAVPAGARGGRRRHTWDEAVEHEIDFELPLAELPAETPFSVPGDGQRTQELSGVLTARVDPLDGPFGGARLRVEVHNTTSWHLRRRPPSTPCGTRCSPPTWCSASTPGTSCRCWTRRSGRNRPSKPAGRSGCGRC